MGSVFSSGSSREREAVIVCVTQRIPKEKPIRLVQTDHTRPVSQSAMGALCSKSFYRQLRVLLWKNATLKLWVPLPPLRP